ncbi:2205_t:CDS:2, partial [Paraglomus brasilianum]
KRIRLGVSPQQGRVHQRKLKNQIKIVWWDTASSWLEIRQADYKVRFLIEESEDEFIPVRHKKTKLKSNESPSSPSPQLPGQSISSSQLISWTII